MQKYLKHFEKYAIYYTLNIEILKRGKDKMKVKNLVYSSILCALSIAVFCITFMSILEGVDYSAFEAAKTVGDWYYIEQYLWGIAGLITVICSPLLFISSVLCILSSIGLIKSKKLDLFLYIINIILAFLIVGVIVNYFLGLGRTLGERGLQLFKGETYFNHSTAFFYLHCAFSVGALVLSILNRKKAN